MYGKERVTFPVWINRSVPEISFIAADICDRYVDINHKILIFLDMIIWMRYNK